jgi:hypothetical protein
MQDSFDHPQGVVVATEIEQQLGGRPERFDGFVDVLHATARLGQAQVRQRIGRVELDHLAEDVDRLAVARVLLQATRDFVVRRQRIARQAELRVDLGELRDDVSVAVREVRRVLADQLANLLVNRDRLQREALGRVVLTDAIVRRDRFWIRLQARLQVTDLQQGPRVGRIFLDDSLVLRDRPVVLLFVDVLLGCLQNFFAIDGHFSVCSELSHRTEVKPGRSAKSYGITGGSVKEGRRVSSARDPSSRYT